MRTVRVRVTGEVQGVFFRASTREYALPLGLVGYAKNLLDGAVELMLTGERRQIGQLLVWLKKEGFAELSECDWFQIENAAPK